MSKKKSQSKRNTPPSYDVILHNDDTITFEYAVNKIINICKLTKENAENKAKEVSEKGKVILVNVHLELAELYQEQLKAAKLTATIQKNEIV